MSGFHQRFRRQILLVAIAATGLALAPLTSASAAASTFGYQGSAFGTNVTVAGVVTSAPTAALSYGCGTPAGLDRTATSAGVDVPPAVLSSNTISVTGQTFAGDTESRTSSRVENINVLGGLITASAVTSVSSSTNGRRGYDTSAAGTSFANLRVLGLPFLLGVDPNTRIDLPGIGYVVLNERKSSVTSSSAALRVTAIRAVVTERNLLGFDLGTTVIVARADSGLSAPTGGFLSGLSYGTAAKVGGLLTSSPSVRVSLACAGTNGVVKERSGAGVHVPGVVDSGTIRNTAVGSTTATTAQAETTSTVQSVSLLEGLVQATGVRSVATATRSGGSTTVSDEGSTFASITVAGSPLVVADIEPNTEIALPGVGTLYLRRTITRGASIEVRAIELVVLQGSLLGTVVQVAVAKAAAR